MGTSTLTIGLEERTILHREVLERSQGDAAAPRGVLRLLIAIARAQESRDGQSFAMAIEDPRAVDGLGELFEIARLRLDEGVPMLDALPKRLLRVAGEILLQLAVAACSGEAVRRAVELPSQEADVLRQAALREVEWPEETPDPSAGPQDDAVLVERRRRAHAERLLEDLGLSDDGRASWTLTASPGETADALARLALEADSLVAEQIVLTALPEQEPLLVAVQTVAVCLVLLDRLVDHEPDLAAQTGSES